MFWYFDTFLVNESRRPVKGMIITYDQDIAGEIEGESPGKNQRAFSGKKRKDVGPILW